MRDAVNSVKPGSGYTISSFTKAGLKGKSLKAHSPQRQTSAPR